MFGGGVLKRPRLVCLAGLCGAYRNRHGNNLPDKTSVAAARALSWLSNDACTIGPITFVNVGSRNRSPHN
jgi:hypothetical protein